MSELLFEGYGVPKVAYGVDGLFSAYKNHHDSPTKLIISTGFHTVAFIPVVNNKIVTEAVRRLNIGGFQLTNYIYRSMQLKYPSHVNSITVGRSEEIMHDHCRIAKDYTEDLNKW